MVSTMVVGRNYMDIDSIQLLDSMKEVYIQVTNQFFLGNFFSKFRSTCTTRTAWVHQLNILQYSSTKFSTAVVIMSKHVYTQL